MQQSNDTNTSTASAFPKLTDTEIECLKKLGTVRTLENGDTLFEAGDRDYSFFAILSGEVTVIDRTGKEPKEVVIHQNREFTGDISMLTGRPAVVDARAKSRCEVVEVPASDIRTMLGEVPQISDKLLEAFQVRRELLESGGFVGVQVIGSLDCPELTQIREFLYKNRIPHTFQNSEEEAGELALARFKLTPNDLPVLACPENVARKPTIAEIANCLGISREICTDRYDVVVIGAGPAGLGAAVYGASEGLKTLVLDRMGPGGQAGQSSKIENYMGFPAGISGADLANRGFLQAMKFGAEFSAPVSVKSLRCSDDEEHIIETDDGQEVRARSILIATGVSYQRLNVPGSRKFDRTGVFYSATSVEARTCQNSTAVVVGGGNSAGQAAMFLSGSAKQVKLLLRGDDLRKSMSDYLAKRVENCQNLEILTNTEIKCLDGDRHLEAITIVNNQTGNESTFDCKGVFIFVGAKPHTEWIPDAIALDDKGYIPTGHGSQRDSRWTLDRAPCELETTCAGVFAAGDVRSGTTKRCAYAAGDGALGITCVHQHLNRPRQ